MFLGKEDVCTLYQQTWMDTTKGLCRTNDVEEQQMLSELCKLLDRTIRMRDYPFCMRYEECRQKHNTCVTTGLRR